MKVYIELIGCWANHLELGDVDAVAAQCVLQSADDGGVRHGVTGQDPGELRVDEAEGGLAREDEGVGGVVSLNHTVVSRRPDCGGGSDKVNNPNPCTRR